MEMYRVPKGILLLGAVLGLAATPMPARAEFKAQFDVGTVPTTVVDNGPGDFDPRQGYIFVSQMVDEVSIVLSASSNQLTPGGNPQIQDSAMVQNSGNTAKNVRIAITDTGFTLPTGSATLVSQLGVSSIGGSNPSSGTFQSHADNSNAEFGTTISTDIQTISFPLPMSQQQKTTNFNTGETFSLSNEFDLTLPASQTNGAAFTGTTFAALSAPVPDNLVLLASSLPFLGLAAWVFRRKQPPRAV